MESWIEVRGRVVESLVEAGTFPPGAVLFSGGIEEGIEQVLDQIHLRVGADEPGSEPELAAMALQVLARSARLIGKPSRLSKNERALHRAERYLSDQYRDPMSMESLAGELGMAYSHFRRSFRAHTGYSPWRYVIHLRLTRARALMASSDATLEDIADQTGFSSGFHLSASFKQAYGISPKPWRGQLGRESG